MTTLRETDPNPVTKSVRDEKLLAAIGKYNQELRRVDSGPAVAPGSPGARGTPTRTSAAGRPFLFL